MALIQSFIRNIGLRGWRNELLLFNLHHSS